jgi:2-haloacid dehalogenase
MRRLPAHPDVPDGLRRLGDAGFRRVALGNSALDTIQAQLAFAGLDGLLDDVLSADEAGVLKPAPGAYALVPQRTGVALGDAMLVAAHAWDVTGALQAGMRAAFVARPGAVPSPIGPQPEHVVASFGALADALGA